MMYSSIPAYFHIFKMATLTTHPIDCKLVTRDRQQNVEKSALDATRQGSQQHATAAIEAIVVWTWCAAAEEKCCGMLIVSLPLPALAAAEYALYIRGTRVSTFLKACVSPSCETARNCKKR